MARLDRWLTRVEYLLLGSALFGASGILFANVILRYVFARGLVWAEEAVRYLIIWMVFLGSSVAARQSNHISIDLALNLVPAPQRAVAIRLLRGLAALFSVALCIWSVRLTLLIAASGQITPGLKIPTWWAYLAIPVGSLLMAFRFAMAAAETPHLTGGDAA